MYSLLFIVIEPQVEDIEIEAWLDEPPIINGLPIASGTFDDGYMSNEQVMRGSLYYIFDSIKYKALGYKPFTENTETLSYDIKASNDNVKVSINLNSCFIFLN